MRPIAVQKIRARLNQLFGTICSFKTNLPLRRYHSAFKKKKEKKYNNKKEGGGWKNRNDHLGLGEKARKSVNSPNG